MRRNIPSVVAGLVLVLILLIYSITYQVRFTEIAIKTTFGRPTDPNVSDPNAAGLRWKWPWPIQGVVKYDKRVQILDSPEEQAQTRDRQIIILTVFCGWRIQDGVAFLQKLETVPEAEDRLRSHLRSEIGVIVGQHSFGEFVSIKPDELKLASIEQRIRKGVAAKSSPYGIKIETLGIRRVTLPQTTTEKVFAQMKAQRLAMAEKTRSEGEAIARRIRSQAESRKEQILSFASKKAQELRAEGAAAAAEEYKVFKEDEDFANFLRKLELLEKGLRERTTYFLDSTVPGIRMLEEDRPILKSEPEAAAPKKATPTLVEKAEKKNAAKKAIVTQEREQ